MLAAEAKKIVYENTKSVARLRHSLLTALRRDDCFCRDAVAELQLHFSNDQ